MQKKYLLKITIVSILFILVSCGPAAEDKAAMHARSKVFQDSIANFIKSSIAEAESPAPAPMATPVASPSTVQAK